MEAWVKLRQLSSNKGSTMRVLFKEHSVSPWSGYELQISTTNRIDTTWVNSSGSYRYAGTFDNVINTTNIWYHIVAVKRGKYFYFYVNGVDRSSWTNTITGTLYNTDGRLDIGGAGNANFFNGTIDEVRIYNYSLSEAQIYANYISGLNNKSISKLVSSETSTNDEWYCQITPNDGYQDGITKNSTSVTILSNSEPSWADDPLILPSSPLETQNLTCYYNTTDIDGNKVINITNWYKNGKSITVLNMPFEGNGNEAKNATDYSGYGNNGTVFGAAFNRTGGKVGGGYRFDGSNDYIEIKDSNSLDVTKYFTLSAWVFPKSGTLTGSRSVISKDGVGTDTDYAYNFYLGGSAANSAYLCYETNNIGTSPRCSSSDLVQGGQWNFIVATFDNATATKMKFYLNGNLIADDADVVPSPAALSTNLLIGRRGNADRLFNGTIDEIKIYNHTLTASQIYAEYIAGLNNKTNKKLTLDQTTAGEEWLCSITPNDGYTDGQTKNSTSVTILSASPTVPTNISCNGGYCNSTYYNEIELKCSGSTDADGSQITYVIEKGNLTTEESYAEITYYKNETTTNKTVVGTTYSNGLSLSWTAEANSKYLVMGYAEAAFNSTAANARARVYNGSAYRYIFIERPGVAYTEDLPFTFMDIVNNVGAQTTKTYTWSYSSSAATAKINVDFQRIVALRLDSLTSNYSYKYTAAEQADVNNAWGDASGDTDNITIVVPTEGTYLLYGMAVVESDITSSSYAMRMNIDGGTEYVPMLLGGEATWSYHRREDRTNTEEAGVYITAIRNLTAGTHTISMQLADIDATPSSDWKYRFLLALRLSDVFNFYSQNSTSQASTTSTSFQEKANVTIPAGTAADYLLIGGITTRHDSTTTDFEEQFSIDNTVIGHREQKPQDANNYLSNTILGVVTLNSSAHELRTQYKRQDASGTVYVKNSDIVAINLNQSDVYSPPIYDFQIIGNHTAGNNYTWDLSSEAVGETYELLQCKAIDLNGISRYSSNFTMSINLTIGGNTAPTITTPIFLPSVANTSSNIQCYATASDSEQSSLTVYWYWFNSTKLKLSGNKTVTSGVSTLITTLGNGNTTRGESWNCTVKPYDGSLFGTNKTARKSINNSIAIQVAPTITPSYPNMTSNLTCNYGTISDADSDRVLNITNWYRNNRSITVLNMPFEGNGGNESKNTTDYSGYRNKGTVFGATWNRTWGKIGGAYLFDGSNDYIMASSSIPEIKRFGNYTFMAWIKPRAISADGYSIIFQNSFSDGHRNGMNLQSERIRFGYRLDSGTYVSKASEVINYNQWYHVAGVNTNGSLFLYLNGVNQTDTNSVGMHSDTGFYIGLSTVNGGSHFFNGSIDEVKVFNRSLTAQQIMSIFLEENKSRTAKTLVLSETNLYEQWHCSVTPNDGYTDGQTKNSTRVTIQNLAPTHSNPTVTPSSPNITSNLTCNWQSVSDFEGDKVINVTNWYKNNKSTTILVLPFEGNGNEAKNVTDYSGYGRNGTVFGATWNRTGGNTGGSYKFDGVNDYIALSDLDYGTNNQTTVTAWVKYRSCSGTDGVCYIISKSEFGSNSPITLGVDEGIIRLTIKGTTITTDNFNEANDGRWHFVAATLENKTARLYLDGTLRKNSSVAPIKNNELFTIGSDDTTPTYRPFNGSIDDVKIYNYTLSASQIYSDYLAGLNNKTSRIITLDETSLNDEWYCQVTPNDGYSDGITKNSTAVTITATNTAPTKVNLSTPTAGNTTVHRRYTRFTWDAAYDAESDPLNYTLNITSPYCSNLYYGNISSLNFTAQSELCIGNMYFWQVRAYDGTEYGQWSQKWNFTLEPIIILNLTTSRVNFGNLSNGDIVTTDSNASPLVVQNDGNIRMNISYISALNSLFSSIGLNTAYFQFKIDNDTTESSSFNWTASQTSWTNITSIAVQNKSAIAHLKYQDSQDTAEIDIKVTVPTTEGAGRKNAIVYIIGESP